MPRISPFVGLLYDGSRAGSLDLVTTPPYDTISQEERRRYLDASPHNVVRLVLGEERPGDDEHANKYMRAAAYLRGWREQGVLLPTPGPSYFAYEMEFSLHSERRRVRGLICLVDLEDWGGSIVPHERTMSGPVEDRLRLMRAVRANLSCIHALHPGPCPPLADHLGRICSGEPQASLTDQEGVTHRMWAFGDDGAVPALLADQPLLIADGHHRYAMALRYRDEMRAAHGPGPWDRVMMLLMDLTTEDPPVLPIHRILAIPPPPVDGVRVRDLQEVLDEIDDDRLTYGAVLREGDELVHRVARLAGEPPTVCALHEQLLDAVPQDALRFTHDAVEAEGVVRESLAASAFILPRTHAGRIRSVIDRGERMPQKSTFFWPKPRTGFVIRPLD